MGKKRRHYIREFKVETVKPVIEGGLGIAHTARDLGVSQSVLHRWKRQLSSDPIHAFPRVGHLLGGPEMRSLTMKAQSDQFRGVWLKHGMFRPMDTMPG